MKKLLPLLLLLAACGTTTVVDRVEVPVLFWEPMDNVKELHTRVPLESKQMTPEQAEADTREAFRRLGADIGNLVAENEQIRFLYDELVKRVQTKPEEAP